MESLQNIQQVSPQYKGYPTKNEETKVTPPVEQKKDGDKKLISALVGLGTIAAAGVAIYKGKGAKVAKEVAEDVSKEAQEKLTKEAQEFTQKEVQKKAAKVAVKKAAEEVTQETQEKIAKETQEKIAKQAQEKIAKEAQEKAAKQAQELYNKPFEEGLSHKSAKDSAAVFLHEEHKNADLALEAATGKKAGRSARESAQVFEQAFSDMELEAATGPKSGKSAIDSARAFIVRDEANMGQRLEFLQNTGSVKLSNVNKRNYKTLRALSNNTISSLSDTFVSDFIQNANNTDPAQVKKILKRFSPDELRKITASDIGSTYLHMLLNKSYNTSEEFSKVYSALKKLGSK